jgi:hypothetical protein
MQLNQILVYLLIYIQIYQLNKIIPSITINVSDIMNSYTRIYNIKITNGQYANFIQLKVAVFNFFGLS